MTTLEHFKRKTNQQAKQKHEQEDIESMRDQIESMRAEIEHQREVIKALKVLVVDGTKEIERLRVEAMKREGR